MIIIILLCLLFPPLILGQGSLQQDLINNRQALEQIKTEIESLKREISKTDIKSSSTLEQIKNIDRELALLSQSLQLLKKESVLLQKKIDENRIRLEERKSKLQLVRDHYARQVLYNYKYGKLKDLELLLTASSINQLLVRYKYMQIIANQEKIQVRTISNEIIQIRQLEENMILYLQQLSMSLKEKEQQRVTYLARKDEKNELIQKLKWTGAQLQQRLREAKLQYEKLQQLISTLEKQRNLREQKGVLSSEYARLNPKNFAKNKGKFPWPAKGKVLHPYGKQRDFKLNTIVNNTGIDIQAKSGTEVRAIYTGVIGMITYLSGYGNTIILDHGDGYYTVYSHLEEIYVEKEQLVESGSVIGLVGDSGSLEGTMLHFAVFANQRAENPESWLK
jgi:septal ring factor EnvC (AmiA/AmiB activator)